MDRKLSKSEQIEELIRQGESCRSQLRDGAISLQQRLDIPARVRSSLKGNPTGWIFGSMATGLAASWIFRRKPAASGVKHRGLPFTLLSLAFTAVRPLAKVWLTGQLKNYLTARAGIAPANPLSPAPAPLNKTH